MNGTYYPNPKFPTNEINDEELNYTNEDIPMQQSYIENILRHNKGKRVKLYASFPDAHEWKDKVFSGTIEQAGRDHIILKDNNGKWYLILMIYLDYVEFDEKIDYSEKKYFRDNN